MAISNYERLRVFIAEMLEWEIGLDGERRVLRGEQNPEKHRLVIEKYRKILVEIFGRHLSRDAFEKRGQARLSSMSTARPPVFDQKILTDTEEIVGKKVYIETFNEKDLPRRRKYLIVLEGGVPKVDAVYEWRSSSGKWMKIESI